MMMLTQDLIELYHVTYLNRLESISESGGLDPAATGVFKQTGYGGYSRGKLFLTEAGGIGYWYSKFEDHAEYHSEDLMDDGMIPVVLRVRVPEASLREDAVGARDAMYDAYYVTEIIDDTDIELWDGKRWSGSLDPNVIEPEQAVEWRSDSEEDDPDYEGFWQFKRYDDNPLRHPNTEQPWYDESW